MLDKDNLSPNLTENLKQATPYSMFINGIMSLEEVRELYIVVEREEILAKYTFPKKPQGDGRWSIYVKDLTVKGGRKKLRAKTLDELKEKVYQFEKTGVSGKVRKNFKTVFEIVQTEYLKYVKDEQKRFSKQNTVSKRTSEYNRFFSGTGFEHAYIDDITKKDIEDVVLMNLEKYDLKPKAFEGMQSIIKTVFDFAYKNYWITDNVYDRIDWRQPKFLNMLIDEISVQDRGYSEQEMEEILSYIQAKHTACPRYIGAYALEMQIIMGLRRGEIPPLRWDDINYDKGYVLIGREQITIKKSKKNKKESFIIVNHTKTWKNRKYPISRDLDDFLQNLWDVHQKYYPDSPYLFPAENENGVITNNVVYNFYRRMCKDLGIQISRGNIRGPHAFRRNALTDFVQKSGGNIIMASELFGNSPEVARKHYYTGSDIEESRKILNS